MQEIYSEAFCTEDGTSCDDDPCSLFLDIKLPSITMNFIILHAQESKDSKPMAETIFRSQLALKFDSDHSDMIAMEGDRTLGLYNGSQTLTLRNL